MDFVTLRDAGYGPALIPVIPPHALISEEYTRDAAVLRSQVGKVPGKRLKTGDWIGFGKFTSYENRPDDYQRWDRWGASIGLRAARFPAFDIDVEDPRYVQEFLRGASQIAGYLFGRVGRAPRVLLPFRAADGFEPSKVRIDLPALGLNEKGRAVNAVELLAAGQQYVIAGIHPKTNAPYSWGKRGLPPAARLPVLDEDKANRLLALAADLGSATPKIVGAAIRHRPQNQVIVSQGEFEAVKSLVDVIPIESLNHDDWVRAGIAIRATLGDAGWPLWAEWSAGYPENTPAQVAMKWQSFLPPFAATIDTLRALAPVAAQGVTAAADFDPMAPVAGDSAFTVLMKRYIWVEKTEQAFDRDTRKLLTSLQFSVANNHVARPTGKESPWSLWLAQSTLSRAESLTYRPGRELIVREAAGECVNTWIAPAPFEETDVDITPWLQHLAFIVPDKEERAVVLDWLSAVVQRPNQKPNWHIVLGSTRFGMGKDLLLDPLRRALGPTNVKSIQAEQLLGQYTDWFVGARLIIVAEMQSLGKRELETKLRPYLAAPPDYVSIMQRYVNNYEVPNIAAFMFLTNKTDALPISEGDRRYFVSWNDDEPKDENYYTELVRWYDAGGREAVARFLSTRDIGEFSMQGRAPNTKAKEEMQSLTLSPVEAWIREGFAEGYAPFDVDLIELSDILASMPRNIAWNGATERRLAEMLRVAGARIAAQRVGFGRAVQTTGRTRGRLYSIRRHEMYADLDPQKIVELFWRDRDKAAERRAKEGQAFEDLSGSKHLF